jgi:hypothetical protein
MLALGWSLAPVRPPRLVSPAPTRFRIDAHRYTEHDSSTDQVLLTLLNGGMRTLTAWWASTIAPHIDSMPL